MGCGGFEGCGGVKGVACGSSYQFMGDAVLRVDKLNHQVCERECGAVESASRVVKGCA